MREDLREDEGRCRRFIETTQDAFVEGDRDLRVTFVNSRAGELFGYARGEMVGLHIVDDLLFPEDRPAMRERLSVRLAGTPESYEQRFRRKDGRPLHLLVSGNPLKDEAGRVIGLFAMMTDMTERRKAAEDLSRLRKAIERSGEAIFLTDKAGVFTYVNPGFTALYGYRADELLGKATPRILKSGQIPPEAYEKFWQKLLGGRAAHAEFTNRRKDGTLVDIDARADTVYGEDGGIVGFLGIQRDITERKQAERTLINLQKLDSIGALAGGIAHDFNNILTVVLGNISLLETRPGLGAEGRRALRAAQEACDAGKGLSQELLTFSKGGSPAVKAMDLLPVLKQAARFGVRGSKVKVVYDLPAPVLTVNADANQVAQVIQNLVINAAQAMPKGGQVKVAAARVELAAGQIPPLPAGPYARVTVADAGGGIAPEHLHKVFDPYFTTKEMGRGLGLSVCHSIMVRHGGGIGVESAPSRGTTFTLHFPAAAGPGLPQPPSPRPQVMHGSGRILVMDDDPEVAATLTLILKRLGYHPESVDDGAAALEAYRRALDEGRPYAALILDLTVPGGMGGKETLPRLAELDPGVKAVASSGYSDDRVFSQWAEHGFAGALAKPFSLREVSQALGRALAPR